MTPRTTESVRTGTRFEVLIRCCEPHDSLLAAILRQSITDGKQGDLKAQAFVRAIAPAVAWRVGFAGPDDPQAPAVSMAAEPTCF